MDTYNNMEEIMKATASVNHETINSEKISSEPLQRYITEFRKELHAEMAGISEIKW